MIVIFAVVVILLVVLLGVSVISNSLTQVAMSDALRAQAQATQALAVAEVLREATVLVLMLALLAVIILAGVIVYRRSRPAKVVNITPRQVTRGEVVQAPQLPAGTPIEQLTQLMSLQIMREMMKEREEKL